MNMNRKMALAMALSLAGLNKDDFRGIMALLSPIESDRRILAEIARTASPSANSESSGISSLRSSRGSNGSIGSTTDRTPSISPNSSRPDTPTTDEIFKAPTKGNDPLQVLYKKRDILNLAGNLKDPSWQMKSPSMPRDDLKSFMANRSIYHRLGVEALEEDYPVRLCRDCGFTEPSPYLFEDV